MAPNIIYPPRDQEYLLPPSLKDWVPADHFVWFLLDAVKCMNLQAFYIGVRLDGSGGALYQPEMMATLLIYSYAKGVRSSRAIEKLCQSDLAYRVICGNLIPDHSSIARFRQTHEKAFASLFCEALGLCREAGFTSVGTIAVDGTKMQGNASLAASLTKETLCEQVEKIIREAKEKDAAEDRSFGAKRGDEIPPELLEPGSRLDRIKKCLRTIEEREKLEQAKEEEKLQQRQEKEAKTGKPLRGRKPKEGKASKAHKANTTDPESRTLKTAKTYIQGYNAQAVANSEQIILAAEVYQDANDQHLLHPMLEKTVENLQAIGETNMPKVALADAGYSNEPALVKAAPAGMEIIAAIRKECQERMLNTPAPRGRIPKSMKPRDRMRRKLQTKRGKRLYKMRGIIIEPVFGQLRTCQNLGRFSRRGKEPCDSEWKLICAAHNLTKLWRKQNARMSSKGHRG